MLGSRGGGSKQTGLKLKVGAVGLVCLTAAACTSGGSAGGSGGAPSSGGDLTFATSVEPECLDPEVGARDVDELIDRNIFDSLVEQTAKGTFKPWLAKSWTISSDQRTYTFTLRPGVVFHDGTPLDAAAVKATLDHAVDPKARSYYAASLISAYSGATVANPTTVAIHLSRPSRPFLQALSTAYLGIQSPKSIRDDAKSLCQKPVGSGPFVFDSWTKGTNVKLSRNPKYAWGPSTAKHTGPARLTSLTFNFVSEDSVRLGALTSGQADAISEVPPHDVTVVRRVAQLLTAPEPGAVYTLLFNTTSGPLSDERVRTAFQRSVNFDKLVESVYNGQYQRAWSVLSPATPDYDKATAKSWPYDPKLANSLLDQAGWTGRDSNGYRTKNGSRLILRWPYSAVQQRDERVVFGQGIQAEAKKAGIDLAFASEDPGKLGADLSSGKNLDIFAMSFVRADPDILHFYFGSDQTVAKGGGNMFRLSDKQLDGWFGTETSTGSPATAASAVAKAQEYINQHALALPTYSSDYLLGVSKKVHGFTFDATAYPLFYDVWLDK